MTKITRTPDELIAEYFDGTLSIEEIEWLGAALRTDGELRARFAQEVHHELALHREFAARAMTHAASEPSPAPRPSRRTPTRGTPRPRRTEPRLQPVGGWNRLALPAALAAASLAAALTIAALEFARPWEPRPPVASPGTTPVADIRVPYTEAESDRRAPVRHISAPRIARTSPVIEWSPRPTIDVSEPDSVEPPAPAPAPRVIVEDDTVARAPAEGQTAPGAIIGYVDSTSGDVEIASVEAGWIPVENGTLVRTGDTIRTKFARVRVSLDTGTSILVNRFTTATFHDSGELPGCRMVGGEIYVEIGDGETGFVVDTPQARVTDLGTRFAVTISRRTGTTAIVAEGSVEARTEAGAVTLLADQESSCASAALPPSRPSTVRNIKDRLAWIERPFEKPDPVARAARRMGMVASWRLDEGGGRTGFNALKAPPHLSLVNTSWTPGWLGPALHFQGNAYAIAPYTDLDAMATGQLTFSAWVLIDSPPEDESAMTIADADITGGIGEFWFHVTGSRTLALQVGSGPFFVLHGTRALATGVWHHVAATCAVDGGQGRAAIYLNGRPARCTTSNPESIARYEQPFLIGGATMGTGNTVTANWHGHIDEVRLYARELSNIEIKKQAAGYGIR